MDGTTHPIFQPVSIYTHAPAFECDYNLHKSNSTFFCDLDESRTALMTKLYGPALRAGKSQLEEQGHKGRSNIILGSVHTSFHKEVQPYERYEVRSRVLGWDQKWCVIGSFFIRPAKGGKEEVLLASAVSKYVVKKRRFTVQPEHCFTAAGWLPKKPEDCKAGPNQGHNAEESNSSDDTVTPASVADEQTSTDQQATPQSDPDIAAPVPEAAVEAAEVVEKLENVASHIVGDPSDGLDISAATPPRAVEWDWHRIDMERLRGLAIVSGWLSLDKDLMEEYALQRRAQ